MEKFLHDDIEQIEYLEKFFSDGWQLFECQVDGSASREVDHFAIRRHFHESNQLWGRYPASFLLITHDKSFGVTGLNAVLETLMQNNSGDFIGLVAYNDGGLISVSKGNLPIHSAGKPADWWSGEFTR